MNHDQQYFEVHLSFYSLHFFRLGYCDWSYLSWIFNVGIIHSDKHHIFFSCSGLVSAISNSDRAFPSDSPPPPPKPFREAFGGVYYIILNKLNDKSHRLLGDKLTQPGLVKLNFFASFLMPDRILKETYIEVSKEILFSLHLPFERLKGSWEAISQSTFCSVEGVVQSRRPWPL